MSFAIVGSGFSGSVLAHELAKAGYKIHVFESRSHVGGNCYTERHKDTNILTHVYGPHIFHTDNQKVWIYVNNFSEFIPYVNRVKTTSQGRVFSLPINLHTINQFFNKCFNPKEALEFIKSTSLSEIGEPQNFEEQALKFIGRDLYEAFFKGYTLKQWGISPNLLPASILKRLPVRFNYDDNYFNHKYQGMPKDGYTPIIESLLSHHNISLQLNTSFNSEDSVRYQHVFYTGPIDAWFSHKYGRLGYRTLDFTSEVHDGDFQGCAVMNYADISVPYTRISEHKHFSPWETHDKTIIFKEYSRPCDEGDVPYYPIRLTNESAMLEVYIGEAKKTKGVSFLGRLGTYRYLDMDTTILEALNASEQTLEAIKHSEAIPTFFIDPL